MDCFKSTGKTVSQVRNVGSFEKILVNDKIETRIIKGNEFEVEVIAGEHIIKNISTKVNNGVLTLDNYNTCNFVRGYKHVIKVNITVPYIKLVTNASVSTMKFENFDQDTLVVRVENSGDVYIDGIFNQVRTSTHGNGDFYLSGTTNSFFVYSNGTNYVRAQNLKIKDYAFIQSLTIGDCFLNGQGLARFEYNIESEGNIYYTGDPGVIVNYSDPNATGKAEKITE